MRLKAASPGVGLRTGFGLSSLAVVFRPGGEARGVSKASAQRIL